MDRLDIVSGEVKPMESRILTLERKVSDPRSMRDQLVELVKTLDRGGGEPTNNG